MDVRIHREASCGHTLVELVLVVGFLAICATIGAVSLSVGIGAQEARGAAQSWQAAAAWGQLGVLWHGGSTRVSYDSGRLRLTNDLTHCGGNLGSSAPRVSADANVTRWIAEGGIAVEFGGRSASPDGGGSLYFDALRGCYRVVIRPESGLTTRSFVGDSP